MIAHVEDDAEELIPVDLHDLKLFLGIPADGEAVFVDYISHVANDGLRPYKSIIQYSTTQDGKPGESLYNHVMNGIFVLEQVRRLVVLTDVETRVLFTAFSIHDINKVDGTKKRYQAIATLERVVKEITNLKLDSFFPNFTTYLADITSLMLRHPAHQWVGMEALDLRHAERFVLGSERLDQLVTLMRAADTIDLSRTLDERKHKEAFIKQLNAVSKQQFDFVTHRVTEQRGSLTNIIHNAVTAKMKEDFNLAPLLLYPDGAAYLYPRGHVPHFPATITSEIAQQVAAAINVMTGEGFQQFIRPINMGITVDKKCLDLNLPFGTLLDAISAIIEKRVIKADKLERLTADSIKRTHSILAKRKQTMTLFDQADLDGPSQDVQSFVEALLASGPVPTSQVGMRIGELIRSYYIFLSEHHANSVQQPWAHIYSLLGITFERAAVYDCFDARMDRAYAIATDLQFTQSDVERRIRADGTRLMATHVSADPRIPVLTTYLEQVLSINDQPRTASDFAASLPSYVRQQHKQCVQCSLPFATEPWMSGDVRSDIKVQLFSNRLGGGPGEPRKRVCPICQIQFLIEKLNYPAKNGEQTVYLHLFPYSFLTAPFLNGLRATLNQIIHVDLFAGALRLKDVATSITTVAERRSPDITFTTRTKQDKGQPYGVYLPRYSDTLGNVISFPINAAGENDTEQFLFVLHHALLLQYHFGCKVLVSTSATPPLDKQAFGDVYFDLTPLSARGLVRQNNYDMYEPGTNQDGPLRRLWDQLGLLMRIRAEVATMKGDPTAELVTAMAEHPLRLFYVAEKLAENKADSNTIGWLIQTIAPHVRKLALSIGDSEMNELDHELRRLAEIAKRGGLRGDPQSYKKNSLMAPMDEVLRKVSLQSQELDTALLQSAAAQDLYEHVERTRKMRGFRTSRQMQEACAEFVQIFFVRIFGEIYAGKQARLLSHEKVLRSAYHFYIRQEHASKVVSSDAASGELGSFQPSDEPTDLFEERGVAQP